MLSPSSRKREATSGRALSGIQRETRPKDVHFVCYARVLAWIPARVGADVAASLTGMTEREAITLSPQPPECSGSRPT